jgi:hypothetical protein
MAFTKADWRQVLINAKGRIKGGNSPPDGFGLGDFTSPFVDLPQVIELDAESPAKWRRADVQALYDGLGLDEAPEKWLAEIPEQLDVAEVFHNQDPDVDIQQTLVTTTITESGSTGAVGNGVGGAFIGLDLTQGVIWNNSPAGFIHFGVMSDLIAQHEDDGKWPSDIEESDAEVIIFRETDGVTITPFASSSFEIIDTLVVETSIVLTWEWSWAVSTSGSGSFAGTAFGLLTPIAVDEDSVVAYSMSIGGITGDTTLIKPLPGAGIGFAFSPALSGITSSSSSLTIHE